jgi:phosphoribosylformylglycinamidine synthase PurS subunit
VKARVLVRLKPGILDAQGASVRRALDGLGFHEVRDVRVGKVVDLDLEGASAADARRRLDEMCARLLVNPVIEDFTVEMVADGLLPEAGAKG